MKRRQLLSLYLEAWHPQKPPFHPVAPPRAPYLSEVRPINLQPVRAALDAEPPRVAPASSALGVVERVFLWLMVIVATSFGTYLAVGANHLAARRPAAVTSRDLQRAQVQLADLDRAYQALKAEREKWRNPEPEVGEVRVAPNPAPIRRVSRRR